MHRNPGVENARTCRDEGYGARNRPGQLEARSVCWSCASKADHERQQVAGGLTVYLPGILHGVDKPHSAVFPQDVVVSAPIAGHRQPAELCPFRIRVPPRCHVYAGIVGPRPENAARPDSRSPADRQPDPQHCGEITTEPGLQVVQFLWPGSSRGLIFWSANRPGDQFAQDFQDLSRYLHNRHRISP
jgi:hypothetical protein